MTRIKSSYLRWKISQPGYYKQRALQMAEQVTICPKEWERKHEHRVDFIKDGRVSDVWKFAINEIVYKF